MLPSPELWSPANRSLACSPEQTDTSTSPASPSSDVGSPAPTSPRPTGTPTTGRAALHRLRDWAVCDGKLKLPNTEVLWAQRQTLRERLRGARREFYPIHRDMSVEEQAKADEQIPGTTIMKVVFTQARFYEGVGDFLHLFSHCIMKTPNESVVEGMGSILDRHTHHSRASMDIQTCAQEAMIHWNGPLPHEAERFLTMSLNKFFGGKKWKFWHQDGRDRFAKAKVSTVLDRHMAERSKFPFLADS